MATAELVLAAGVLSESSYIPCRGQLSTTGVTLWVFQLYLGQPPNSYQGVQPGAACMGAPPLALQLGQIDALGATLLGIVLVASVVWRQPLSRFLSRFAGGRFRRDIGDPGGRGGGQREAALTAMLSSFAPC
jgi:hypothetical protein